MLKIEFKRINTTVSLLYANWIGLEIINDHGYSMFDWHTIVAHSCTQ